MSVVDKHRVSRVLQLLRRGEMEKERSVYVANYQKIYILYTPNNEISPPHCSPVLRVLSLPINKISNSPRRPPQ